MNVKLLVRFLLLANLLTLPAAYSQEEPAKSTPAPEPQEEWWKQDPDSKPGEAETAPAPAAEQDSVQSSGSPPPNAQAAAPPAEVQSVPVVITEDEKPAAEAPTPEGATRLDDIQVTSSKRVKSQRDLPGSVGAIRGETLEKISAQGLKDYVKLVPGVVYIDRGGEEGVPIIRGVATSISFGATPATVGVYMDDMPFADLFRPIAIPDLNPFDLDRVEILKGPQGTLFGSGALAGAIRYLVQKPRHSVWETKLSGTYSHTKFGSPNSVVAGALNVPLFSDKVALRGVGVVRKDGGLYDESSYDSNGNELRNVKDADKLDQTSFRVLGSWNATDELKVSAFYFDQKTHGDGLGFADNRETPKLDGVPFASPRDHEFGGGNLVATYDLGWGRLLSSTNRMTKHNYSVLHQEFVIDTGNQNQNEFVALAAQDVRGYTQEFRLSSPDGGDSSNWEWLVGASFLHFNQDRFGYLNIGPDRPDPTSPDQVSDADKAQIQVFERTDQLGEELAFFGEATRRLGEQFELTVGARQYETTLDVDGEICGAQILLLFQMLCRPDHYEETVKGFNPKFSLRYLHDRNMQVYLLAAKGFQFGGVQLNPPAPGFPESAERAGYSFGPYKSSTLWNYELGLRTEWLDRRLRFDLTAFYMDWTDLQLSIVVKDPATQAPLFVVIANVGRAHSEGLEAALEVVPFTGATFTSSAAWVSALTDTPFPAPDGTNVPPGARLPGAPHFQWANVFTYGRSLPFFTSFVGGFALTHAHLGSAPENIIPRGSIGGFDTLDTRLTLARPGSSWFPDITGGVNNLTDVRASAFNLNQPSPTGGAPIDLNHFVTPRTVLVTLAWRF